VDNSPEGVQDGGGDGRHDAQKQEGREEAGREREHAPHPDGTGSLL
jgi:hypothetical protein